MNRPLAFAALFCVIATSAAAGPEMSPPPNPTTTTASPTAANPKNNPADCKNTAPGHSKDCATTPDSTTPSTTTTPSTKAPGKTSTDEPPVLPPTNNCTTGTQPGQTLPQSKSQCSPTDKSAPSQGGQYGH